VTILIVAYLVCLYKPTQVTPHPFSYTIEQLEEKLKTPGFDINARYLVNDAEGTFAKSLITDVDETLLSMAAKQDNLDMVKFLVANGAKAEFNVDFPMHDTTDLRIVEFFIQNGMDVNTCAGMACVTLLHKAAGQGDLELAKLCFKYNANPNFHINGAECPTSLMIACKKLKNPNGLSWYGPERKHKRQYFEVIKLLVKHGAEIGALSYNLETAIDFAKNSGHKKVVEFLQKELQKKRPYPYSLEELRKKVTDPQFDINAEYGSKWNRFGRTLLALAAYNDDLPYVEFLVSHGARCKDSAPLEAAARNGNPEIMRLLLKTPNSLKAPLYSDHEINSFILHPLSMACLHCKAGDSRYLEVIKLLVNSGADLNYKNYCFDRTPLILLVLCHLESKKNNPYSYTWKGNIDAVEFLLKHGAKVGIESTLMFKEIMFEAGTIMNIIRELSLKTPGEKKLKNLLEKYLKING
jgi:ankyrin repeat protein